MEGHAPFPTERRAHLGLAVRAIEPAIRFYEVLLGEPPTKVRPGYAKFEPADPSLNLSLNEVGEGAAGPRDGVQHFGVQVRSSEAVREAIARLSEAGLESEIEEATACCYAVQDKVWVTDPDGHRWEVFVVLDPDSPERRSATSDCCAEEPAERCEDPKGCCET